MATLNTNQYQQEWETTLAMRLDKPQNWKEVCDVRYTNKNTIVLPYISTGGEPAVSTGKFASTVDRSDTTKIIPLITVTQSSETLQISTTDMDSVYMDFADEAQSDYVSQMYYADMLGKKMGERVETIILANNAAWTDLGDDGSGGIATASTTQLTVTANNIDDICRAIIEQIQTANGFTLYRERGGFVVWRPADWNKLTGFMQANGYRFADTALAGASDMVGKNVMDLFHYVSTSHAANHVMAGVRGAQVLGLLNRTYGKPMFIEHPASSTAGNLSGTLVYSRLDYGLIVQTNIKPVIFDLNVA